MNSLADEALAGIERALARLDGEKPAVIRNEGAALKWANRQQKLLGLRGRIKLGDPTLTMRDLSPYLAEQSHG